MRPADIARAWRSAAVAVFRAEVRDGPSLTLHPMDGGFLYVLWNRGDTIRQPVEDCIAGGGRCRARGEDAAIAEAVRKLTALEVADG